jgi:2-hydroxy-3-keto-5-methylthiopentenyl-1-phosphate phosphatase
MNMKKVAVMYDFDKTLSYKDMQEYSLIPDLGYQDPNDFWKEVGQLSRKNHMDSIIAYLYLLEKKFRDQGRPLHREDFYKLGEAITLYPGVTDWFDRLNDYGKKQGLEIEHYIISSGMQEIISAVPIASHFRKIYACRYYYDEHGEARWPALVVNYTTKTQYIFRINKQVLDENEDDALNSYVDPRHRPIPFSRMIYVADGLTDVPCMRLVKEYGGRSVVVYNQDSDKAKKTAARLIRDGRADFMVKADYTPGSDAEQVFQKILDHMQADSELEDLEGVVR